MWSVEMLILSLCIEVNSSIIMDLLTYEHVLEPVVASTVTPLLASQIQQATKSLPSAHLILPANGESFNYAAYALQRLQDE
jgi:hypothetical protein